MGSGERKRMVLGRALAVLCKEVGEGLSHRKLKESKRAATWEGQVQRTRSGSMPCVLKEQQRPVP